MIKNLYVKSDFEAVFLINGAFTECAESISIDDEAVYFITALPLNAAFLPYTVKLAAAEVRSNPELAKVYSLSPSCALLRLSPRYAYVYSPSQASAAKRTDSPVAAFFFAVKDGDFVSARRYLTKELSAAADDEALSAFFDGYSEIFPDPESPENGGAFYLSGEDGNASSFSFKLSSGLIDEVTELGEK